MRKLFALIFSVLLICTCAMSVCAVEAQYSTAMELYQGWHDNFPDYVCGVWSTDGGTSNLTFGIQNNEAGEAGKQEILELVEDDSTVSFAYQVYTRNYLYQIFQEMHVYFEKDVGLISLGLSDTANRVQMEILDEREYDPDTQNMIAEITNKYGDAVSVEFIDERYVPTADVGEVSPTWMTPYAQPALFLQMVVMIILLIGIAVVIATRRKMQLLQTNHGTIVSATTPPSSKEVEDMVKKSNCDVPSDLKQRVMAAIDNNE